MGRSSAPVAGCASASTCCARVMAFPLWAESFDVPGTGFFAVQDEVCRQIVTRLRLSLTTAERDRLGRRQTSSAEAYEYYMKGMNAFDPNAVRRQGRPSSPPSRCLRKR